MRCAQRDVSTGMATTDDLQDTHNKGNKYSKANVQKKKNRGWRIGDANTRLAPQHRCLNHLKRGS